ncbi:MAG: DUF1460 domain-containing protein [Acidobacteria bacterium]|nr:DUF1460 domain-containing protein [Acidobacteriota bacterium]MBI3424486.1 DUF1460 domain-containing protein [Acidobacteriota bacterium]
MRFKQSLFFTAGFLALSFSAAGQQHTARPRTVVHSPAPVTTMDAGNLNTARTLLAAARATATLGDRAQSISAHLIGAPYLLNPLIGSPTEPEQLVTRFDGFDCVTFVETVLALAVSHRAEEFPAKLREIRYENGRVDYRARLHYMTAWSRYQVQRGFLHDLTSGPGTLERTVTLSVVPGIPPKQISFRYFPKQELDRVSKWLANGDLIFFVAPHQDLDVYHVGLVFREGGKLLVRHARQQRGQVIEQPLAGFIRLMQGTGFMIYRPVENTADLRPTH